jgi:hypothetical protein
VARHQLGGLLEERDTGVHKLDVEVGDRSSGSPRSSMVKNSGDAGGTTLPLRIAMLVIPSSRAASSNEYAKSASESR